MSRPARSLERSSFPSREDGSRDGASVPLPAVLVYIVMSGTWPQYVTDFPLRTPICSWRRENPRFSRERAVLPQAASTARERQCQLRLQPRASALSVRAAHTIARIDGNEIETWNYNR